MQFKPEMAQSTVLHHIGIFLGPTQTFLSPCSHDVIFSFELVWF